MLSPLTLGLVLLPLLSAAYPEEPPTTAAPDTVADCTWWQVAAETDTCASISEYWGLTDAQFTTYNPSLADGCKITPGNSYCVESNFGLPPPSSTTSTLVTVTSASQTPMPTPTTLLGICEEEAGSYASTSQSASTVLSSVSTAFRVNAGSMAAMTVRTRRPLLFVQTNRLCRGNAAFKYQYSVRVSADNIDEILDLAAVENGVEDIR
ncbi:hypothetical protein BKA58DRAFT_398058 [Alternaria rosae]|uniref:uncharacterized protein n=1 Tax=Alternaria rosae TaxID=1187941 RepID=UPI001E8E5720|nr:uncharacterized protein BKA58DRAFT_398058 [Alternaria rosae]KAH6877966.1 hypothetical protein BKA58DRAFT_398058 [Alternaria rosae]